MLIKQEKLWTRNKVDAFFFAFCSKVLAQASFQFDAMNRQTLLVPSAWVPDEKAANSVNGVGMTILYINQTDGSMIDRTFWVYWGQPVC